MRVQLAISGLGFGVLGPLNRQKMSETSLLLGDGSLSFFQLLWSKKARLALCRISDMGCIDPDH